MRTTPWLFVLMLAADPSAAQDLQRPLAASSSAAGGPRRSPARWVMPARSATAPGGTRAAPVLVGAGILGGGVGLLAGAYAGALSGDLKCRKEGGGECDAPVIAGALIGGVAGEALMLPLAEHLVGGRRGPFLAELGASAALAGAGLLLLAAVHYDKPMAPAILVAVPIAQLTAVTLLERGAPR